MMARVYVRHFSRSQSAMSRILSGSQHRVGVALVPVILWLVLVPWLSCAEQFTG
jgi:hypothetical protein